MRRGIVLLAQRSALITSKGISVANAITRKGSVGADEVVLQMKASAVSSEDTRELVYGAFLDVKGEGAIGTSGCGVVTAVGARVSGISQGDFVLASAPLKATGGEKRVGLWHSDEVEIVLPVSSVVKVAASISKNKQRGLEAATLPLLLSAYHMLRGLKTGDTVMIDEQSNNPLQKALVEVAEAADIDVKSIDSTKRAAAKGAQLAITCRSGSNSVNMMRTLGPGGTLIVYNAPNVEPLDGECTVNIPVASSIFADVTIRGFGGFQAWHQSEPESVQQAMNAVQTLIKDGKLSPNNLLASATIFSLDKLSTTALQHSQSGLSVIDLAK